MPPFTARDEAALLMSPKSDAMLYGNMRYIPIAGAAYERARVIIEYVIHEAPSPLRRHDKEVTEIEIL